MLHGVAVGSYMLHVVLEKLKSNNNMQSNGVQGGQGFMGILFTATNTILGIK